MIAINPDAFIGLSAFKQNTDVLIKRIKEIPPEPSKRVLIPGEPELETREQRQKDGIPVPEETWQKIQDLAKELDINL